ncbi:MurR/RpiR family transcriptional regulator [Rheinheimera muenzenbergensis]|jgi:RpiR family carbohydrate utilization transcriptional regulator|uniref:MurR/RpiR family transcriptional regulator n=1 Tax=Rheinheimera muenzenbergensis TaxID=1193628 RepID=A0ABU8CB05_9GAMM|nr:MurR/RpiR family transcriptional regulator [Gammaproteobacteria bacterium]MBU1555702.1 MurR/RpiR family transcriptional regulator [Gammaproteobacteria bacterium]MBU2072639.1 MurR/RpiR family transcriptional regulator [Gammaproteobacteria bacterium]MBU2182227.1 MurR/RpiR family transcriptional regulator [Gammaproteobacteria bacterium]MBU2204841.1 MurR/RpiR family transcriptional regulator [Gammaproteobacteria bacterium]
MSYEIDVLSRISERFVEMSESEQRVAQLILDNVKAATEMSIARLADAASVSQATVTRFARTVDCKDVRQLKVKLAQSLAVGQRFVEETPDLDGIQGVYEAIKNTLDISRKLLVEADIHLAVSYLQQARMIFCFGMGGGSSIGSQELQYRLFRFGMPVSSYQDGVLTRMVAASVEPQDVVVAISLTGNTAEIIDAAAIARQYGAKVIAITRPGSPLAANADITLGLQAPESDFIYKPSASRYAMLAIIDVLATEVAKLNKRKSRDKLRRVKLSLDSHRGGDERQPLGD